MYICVNSQVIIELYILVGGACAVQPRFALSSPGALPRMSTKQCVCGLGQT